MSKHNEKISAYLDGEIHRDEVMSFSLSAETDDASTSVRYQLIGDALRGEAIEFSMLDISVAVREALADENIVDQSRVEQSRVQATRINTAVTGTVVSSVRGLADWLMASWLRPVAGMAVAATVAVVMVVGVTQQDERTGGQVASLQPVMPTVATIASNQPLQTIPAQAIPAINNSELNPYLSQHFATQGALQSRMPYVRAVSYESEQ